MTTTNNVPPRGGEGGDLKDALAALRTISTLMGVTVKVSTLLPPNRAAVFVNDELRAIIDLDGPDATRPGGRE